MNTNIDKKIELLANIAKEHNYTDSNINKIIEAVNFAKIKHNGQFRASGEPYIIHPIETAIILIDWKMDVSSVIAGLLHDVLEDTFTEEIEIKKNFGDDVLFLVKNITKVSLYSKQNRQDKRDKSKIEKDYIVQVFISMTVDIRAMIIKLADRYHNMTTIKYLKPEKQLKIAKETLDVYANVAGRMGMYKLKTQLQDLSFAIIKPEEYKKINNSINNLISSNLNDWQKAKNKIIDILSSNNIQSNVKDRIKGVYSTYDKVIRGKLISDIHDIYALRIIVPNILDCYKTLGLINMNFNYISNAFKDYISKPKFNLYQSIHTTILVNNSLIEIQIRTPEMDSIAEYGIAAHWNYKEHNGNSSNINSDLILDNLNNNEFIKQILENPNQNIEKIKKFTKEKVFDILILNNEQKYTINHKTSCLDLSLKFSREKFPYLKQIYINGRLSSFDSLLHNGDVIKFVYSNKSVLNQSWFNFTSDSTTLETIKEILDTNIKTELQNTNIFLNIVKNKLGSNYCGLENLKLIIKNKLHIPKLEDLLKKLPSMAFEDNDFINIFDSRKSISKPAFNKFYNKYYLQFLKPKYFKEIKEIHFKDLKFPSCCNKIPGMAVVGILNKENFLVVHDAKCSKIATNNENFKIIPLEWDNNQVEANAKTFKFLLKFDCIWSPSIGNIITSIMNRHKISLSELKVERIKKNNICTINLLVYVSNIKWIKILVNDLYNEIKVINQITF